MKYIKKFLEFNGKKIFFLAKDGQYWIAIKPICESLNVDFVRQLKNIKKDAILGPALSNQTMQVGNDQSRNWACLPEFFIYGWIFSIQSKSEALQQYKWKCYEVLYNYFHGSITNRKELIAQKAEASLNITRFTNKLNTNEDFAELRKQEQKLDRINSQLRRMDSEMLSEQKTLWDQDLQ